MRRLLAFLVVVMVGCSSEGDRWTKLRPKVVAVTGVVLLDGQPVNQASVTFINDELKRSAIGRTDASGHFRLTTFEPNDGAVPGSHRVTVTKYLAIDRADPNIDYSTTSQVAPPPEMQWIVPQRYQSPETSQLTAEVKEQGANEFLFDLTSGPSAK